MSGWDSTRHDHGLDAVMPSPSEGIKNSCIVPHPKAHLNVQRPGRSLNLSQAFNRRQSCDCCQPGEALWDGEALSE
eukprot:2490516-Karenia_brevis.AAC.1